MESPKVFSPTRCKNRAYQYGLAINPGSCGAVYRAENGNLRNFGSTNRQATVIALKQCLYKWKLRVWRPQKCVPLLGSRNIPVRGYKLPRLSGAV